MALILISDNILEFLKCDYCHKYLSVKPIKVHNRKIACGRCWENTNEEFASSLYNNITKNILFKCVNQYDGCQALLKSTQMLNHERNCRNEEYKCLLCEDTTSKLPTYLFPTHIKTKHRKAFLNENFFTIDLHSTKENILFYIKEDYLFFIKSWIKYNSLFINAVYLRGTNEMCNVFERFSFFHNGEYVETDKKSCFSVTENELKRNQINEIKLDGLENGFLNVLFDFEIQKSTKYIDLGSENQFGNVSHGSPLKYRSIINIALGDIMRNSECMWSRRLNLKFPSNELIGQGILSISASQTKLVLKCCDNSIFDKIFICFHCILCKCVIFSTDFKNIRVTRKGTIQHLVCDICSSYIAAYTEIVYLSSLMSLEMYECVQYSCFNKCENSESEVSVLEHNQKTCKLSINCLAKCLFVAHNFISLQDHLLSKHNISVVLVTDSNYNGFCVSSDLKFLLFYNHIIMVTGETIDNAHYISAEICNLGKNEKIYLIVTVSHNESIIGTFFNTKLRVDKKFKYVSLNFMTI